MWWWDRFHLWLLRLNWFRERFKTKNFKVISSSNDFPALFHLFLSWKSFRFRLPTVRLAHSNVVRPFVLPYDHREYLQRCCMTHPIDRVLLSKRCRTVEFPKPGWPHRRTFRFISLSARSLCRERFGESPRTLLAKKVNGILKPNRTRHARPLFRWPCGEGICSSRQEQTIWPERA